MARCPRCGKGRLFKNVALRPVCGSCGSTTSSSIPATAPIFVIFILGFLALGAKILHLGWRAAAGTYAIMGVATLLVALGLLRLLKATLIALQYKHKAEEGRLARD
jgi:uncharacterized protein (DUF983 family)